MTFKLVEGLPSGHANRDYWGLDDPAEVDGTDEEKLTAFRHTRLELTERLRPFVEIALRVAGRDRRPVLRPQRGRDVSQASLAQ